MLPVVYTILLCISAALVTLAATAVLRMIYPSLRLFFPKQSGAIPHGAALSVVMLGFVLATYVPPLLVLAAVAVLLLLGYGTMRPVSMGALALGVMLAAGLAIWAEQERLRDIALSPLLYGLLGLMLLAPLVAAFSFRDSGDTRALFLSVAVLLAAAIAGPLLTGAVTHGTAAAAVALGAIGAALRHDGRIKVAYGAAALVPVAMVASHVMFALAHAGQAMVAVMLQATLCAGYVVLFGMRR